MRINMRQLFEIVGERLSIDYSPDIEAAASYAGVKCAAPAAVKGVMENRAGIVTLNYDLIVNLHQCCDRCLSEFNREYSFSFEHTIVKSLNTDSDDYIKADGDSFDMDECVVSDLLLQLPTKILCKEDCKGLCYVCGNDLNKSECGCKRIES